MRAQPRAGDRLLADEDVARAADCPTTPTAHKDAARRAAAAGCVARGPHERHDPAEPDPQAVSEATEGVTAGHHDVSIRLPAWFASDGFILTPEQIQDPEYVFHVFLPELMAFFTDSPEELQVRVDGGAWRRLGGPA